MTCPYCGAVGLAASNRCGSCNRALPSGHQALTGLLTPVPLLSSITNTGLPEADTTGMPRLTTEVTTLADMTVRVGVSLPDSEAATRFGDAAAAAETLFEPGGRTSGSANGGPTADGGPLAVGQAFGNRYHIIRALGVGGMGAVYQAFDAELGIAVAIKVIRPEIMADAHAAAEVERRFKRELLLARQVTHTNVVRIHDLGELHGIKYITMSYVEGTDLATVLKSEGRLPIPTVLRIVRQVASGLVAAHGAGVVHRDLKPANIMIAKDGEALIMDFGIAHSTDQAGAGSASVSGMAGIPSNLLRAARYEVTMQGAIVGTVEYMAPEQAKGRTVDQRADVYALGLILYDMLVGGRRAERADGAIEELQARMEHAPTPVKSAVPEIPATLDALVSRCLEPDPDKRFQTSQELAAALALLDDEGVPIPIPPRFSKKLIAAAALGVTTLVGSTWYFTRTPPPVKPHDPVTVLIADFANNTGDPTFNHTLEPMLRLALEGAGFISANDRTQDPIRVWRRAAGETRRGGRASDRDEAGGRGSCCRVRSNAKGDGYDVSVKAAQPITGNVVD